MISKKKVLLLLFFSYCLFSLTTIYGNYEKELKKTNIPYTVTPYQAPTNKSIDKILGQWLNFDFKQSQKNTLQQIINIDRYIVFKEGKDDDWNSDEEPSFLESYPRPYLKKIYIQFYKKKSAIIRLTFDKKKVNYLTLLQILKKRCTTEPIDYTFNKITWQYQEQQGRKEKNKIIILKRNYQLLIYDQDFFKTLQNKLN